MYRAEQLARIVSSYESDLPKLALVTFRLILPEGVLGPPHTLARNRHSSRSGRARTAAQAEEL